MRTILASVLSSAAAGRVDRGTLMAAVGRNAVAESRGLSVSIRCIAVPGDAPSKVGRLPPPNADLWPASGRRFARKWQRHRPVWGGLLTLRNWAGKARGRSAPV